LDYLTLEAHDRSVTGKKVKALRRKGLLPANVYGHNVPSRAIQLDAVRFSRLQPHITRSSLISLQVEGGAEHLVMIHRVQKDVLTGKPEHVEFFQVNLAERLTATVPLILTGLSEDVQRNQGLVLLHSLGSIEVLCLPGDLPESIEVPSDKLVEAGDAIYVRDLPIDRTKIEVRTDEDKMVASLAASQIVPEEEAPAAAGEAATTQGEQPSEP